MKKTEERPEEGGPKPILWKLKILPTHPEDQQSEGAPGKCFIFVLFVINLPPFKLKLINCRSRAPHAFRASPWPLRGFRGAAEVMKTQPRGKARSRTCRWRSDAPDTRHATLGLDRSRSAQWHVMSMKWPRETALCKESKEQGRGKGRESK